MSIRGARFFEKVLFALALFTVYGPILYLLKDGLTGGETGLSEEVVWPAVINTFTLVLAVLALSGTLGFTSAWCLQFYPIPGRRFLQVGLFLPLVFPAYVLAFIFVGALGLSDFSPQGELWGLVAVLSLSLFPYVYIFALAGLRRTVQSDWEVHQSLGLEQNSFFAKVVIPKAYPFVLSGMVLVAFETLADFGAASVINVDVVTTLIYKVWFGFFSFSGAMLVAAYYLLVILVLIKAERLFHRPVTSDGSGRFYRPQVFRWQLLFGTLWCWGLFAVAVLWPSLQILLWFMRGVQQWSYLKSGVAFINSISLGLGAGAVAALLALGLAYTIRILKGNYKTWESTLTVGYSVPGTIVAVAMLVVAQLFGLTDSLFGAFAVLLFGMIYKFFSAALRSVGGVMQTLPRSLDDYHRTTDKSWWYYFSRGQWPLLRSGFFTAVAYVSLEVIKEMPITLMTAPSRFVTLSIQIFNFTSEGEWEKAAVPGLFLILAGALSTMLLYQRTRGMAHD